MKKKLIIVVTVPVVLETWLRGQAKYLSQFYEIEIITSYSETIYKIEDYEDVPIKTFDFNRKINFFKDLKVLVQLFFYFLKAKPYIVYTLTPKAGLLGMITSWMAKVPYRIHSVVGLPHIEAKGTKKNILVATEKITYYFATNLYCNSFILKSMIEKLANKHVDVIGHGSVNGVDTDFFKDDVLTEDKSLLMKRLGFCKDVFIITFIGRIVKDKGIDELIDVFNKLSKKYFYIRLLLIGDYKNEVDTISEYTKKLIKNHKAVKYLEFQEDIREFLSITDLFVLPSYREGLPNVLIEAGSFGIPLIATDINGCNEVVKNDYNGILVEKKNKFELSEAMEKLIVDKEYYKYIKGNVRKSILERYDQKYFWNELSKEFKKIESINT